jgi:PadR family transcriptional regulator PadR
VSGQAVKGHLDTMLLALIRDGATYGYAIAERLRTQSDGPFDLPDGTIYPALRRLEDEGFLTSAWVSLGERKRKVYTLTGKGERELVSSTWRSGLPRADSAKGASQYPSSFACSPMTGSAAGSASFAPPRSTSYCAVAACC